MKRILLGFTILLSLTLLFGCNKTESLEKVSNINFDEFLSWNAVENAAEYVVDVNGEEFIVPLPYLSIIQEGSYEVSVFARADGYEDSEVSEFSFEIDYDQDATILLEQNGDNLTWNEIDKATHYFLVIDTEVIRLESNYYELIDNFIEATYVYAIFPDGSKTVNSNVLN